MSRHGSVLKPAGGLHAAALAALIAVGAAAPSAAGAQEKPSSEQVAFFENKVRPVLAQHCSECHSAAQKKVKGGFNMDSRASMLRGGQSGAALVPGDPQGSPLIDAVEWRGENRMPPKKQLSQEQITALKAWIAMGAPDPREGPAVAPDPAREHWAFKPLSGAPKPPPVRDTGWVKTPVDQFVLAKLEAKGMRPAAAPESGTPAEVLKQKEALLRRAYFDLIGIPPSPEHIRYFVTDPSPRAFEKVIDRLLANPHHGERWARHWMDTARYSDTGGVPGRGYDQRFPYAWGYRDWLIDAINQDMPYDRFILHQLAADQLSPAPDPNWAALAFLTIGQASADPDEIINERIDSIGRGFLGLTIACARCHDHKFDPITQADYYALHGVFRSVTQPIEGPLIDARTQTGDLKAFELKLKELKDHAWAAYLHIAKRENARMRAHASAYFQRAMASTKKIETEQDRAAIRDLEEKLHLTHEDTYWIRGEFAPNFKFNARDPVLGPFVALASDEQRYFEEIMTGKRTGYHPMVLAFLAKQKTLPTSPAGAGDLFERFWAETIAPVAGKPVDPKCTDFVSEVRTGGGVTTGIWNLREKVVDHPELPLMELAVYPWRLIAEGLPMRDAKQIEADDSLELKLLLECRGHDARGSELETSSKVNGINMFKLTSPARPLRAMVVEDLPQPVDSPVYPRGNKPASNDPNAKRLIPRRFLEAFSPGGAKPFRMGSGRLELAQAIASKENPLTARVAVNRVWMHHFGEGLVRTPDDLGSRSGEPSHPELLDFITWWFVNEYPGKPAWSVKWLHKLIMLSSVYQQSSYTPNLAEYQAIDPANFLLWRSNIRRLDFEAFRDALLTMSGDLEPTLHGPPVNLVSEPYSHRRSIYGYIDRAHLPDVLTQFDFANPAETNTRRGSSIIPQQSLFLMNSPFTIGVVRRIMERSEVKAAVAHGMESGIAAVYRILFQRTPTPLEVKKATEFLKVEAGRQSEIEKNQKSLLAASRKRAEEILQKEKAQNEVAASAAIVNAGTLEKRAALTPWESLVQFLLYCNEAVYLK